jgi:hypothetical protein
VRTSSSSCTVQGRPAFGGRAPRRRCAALSFRRCSADNRLPRWLSARASMTCAGRGLPSSPQRSSHGGARRGRRPGSPRGPWPGRRRRRDRGHCPDAAGRCPPLPGARPAPCPGCRNSSYLPSPVAPPILDRPAFWCLSGMMSTFARVRAETGGDGVPPASAPSDNSPSPGQGEGEQGFLPSLRLTRALPASLSSR